MRTAYWSEHEMKENNRLKRAESNREQKRRASNETQRTDLKSEQIQGENKFKKRAEWVSEQG
jgi:hypothetical protein